MNREHRTSNAEHPTSKSRGERSGCVRRSVFEVGCSMFLHGNGSWSQCADRRPSRLSLPMNRSAAILAAAVPLAQRTIELDSLSRMERAAARMAALRFMVSMRVQFLEVFPAHEPYAQVVETQRSYLFRFRGALRGKSSGVLTLTLSPSAGEREDLRPSAQRPSSSDFSP